MSEEKETKLIPVDPLSGAVKGRATRLKLLLFGRRGIMKRGMVYVAIIDRNMREHLYICKPNSNSVTIGGKTYVLNDRYAVETADRIKKYYFWEESYEQIPMSRENAKQEASSDYLYTLLHHARLSGKVKPRGLFGMEAKDMVLIVICLILMLSFMKGFFTGG